MESNKYVINSNIVNEETLKKVTSATLGVLADTLEKSFGPYGSNAAINNTNTLNDYSKDGRTILGKINFTGAIEMSICEEVKEITRNVDMKVGDGTTSAILLTKNLYDNLVEVGLAKRVSPYQVIRTLNDVSNIVKEDIVKHKTEFSPEAAREIAYISTNGDAEMSDLISDLYKKYGDDVFIDVKSSNDQNTKIKVIDGLSIEDGYSDPAFINRPNNICELNNPRVYLFGNNIDTPQMSSFLRTIIHENILEPLEKLAGGDNDAKIYPTVIIAPFINRDQSPYLEQLIQHMIQSPIDSRLPLMLVVSNKDTDRNYDVGKLCGCKVIQKYIDPKQYEEDVKAGLAPTLENIHDFHGTCDMVSADANSTRFMNPKCMYNKDGSMADTYRTLLQFLKTEIEEAKRRNEGIITIGKLRKRYNILRSNMIELYVGGISSTDMNYRKDLIEDAVKNCKSASDNGVGYGANVIPVKVLNDLLQSGELQGLHKDIANSLYRSYVRVVETFYLNSLSGSGIDMNDLLSNIILDGIPYNIITKKADPSVKSSIETDIAILDSVVKIISVLYTSNLFLATSPALASPYKSAESYVTVERV